MNFSTVKEIAKLVDNVEQDDYDGMHFEVLVKNLRLLKNLQRSLKELFFLALFDIFAFRRNESRCYEFVSQQTV